MRPLLAAVLLVSCARSTAPRTVDASVVFAKRGGGGDLIDGRIHCESTKADEVACSLSHEGDASVTVCFHVELTCRNGSRASAESCRMTAPGTEVRTLHAAEGCDAIEDGRVTDAWTIDR
jgi:hypothetical protein